MNLTSTSSPLFPRPARRGLTTVQNDIFQMSHTLILVMTVYSSVY